MSEDTGGQKKGKAKAGGCYNCMKRRIICDRALQGCQKCAKKGLVCPGYGVRYRFKSPAVSNQDNASPSGSRLSSNTSSPPSSLKWLPYSPHPSSASTKGGAEDSRYVQFPASGVQGCSPPQDEDADAEFDFCERDGQLGCLQAVESSSPDSSPPPLDLINLPPLLFHRDPQVRFLFRHFANHVSPVMLMFDDNANGYRYQILPTAHDQPIIQRAVCVAAAFHLTPLMPHLRVPAETGRAAIISKLRSNPSLDVTTWTVLLLLIVGDLITGHEDVVVLYSMLATFLAARKQQAEQDPGLRRDHSKLEDFLDYQSRLISFFARPFLRTTTAVQEYSEVLESPLGSFQKYAPRPIEMPQPTGDADPSSNNPKNSIVVSFLDRVFRDATEIYILRATSTSSEPHQESFMKARLARLRHSFEQHTDLSMEGMHAVVWPAFIGAAESRSSDDRRFFVSILKYYGRVTGYGNVHRGLAALPHIWEKQAEQSWTAALPGMGTVIM